MPATYEPIATNTLGSTAATVTFSSIPGTYTDLVLVSNVANNSTGYGAIWATINSDTSTNYSSTFVYGTGSAAGSSRQSNASSGVRVGEYGNNSTTFANSIAHFMNYSNTTTNKTVLEREGAAGNDVAAFVSLWRSTAAITRLDISGTTFAIGSTFTLYGIKAA